MQSGGSCFGKFFILAFVPLLFIIFVALNYFGIIGFSNINIHTFVILVVIYLIFLFFIPHNAYVVECKIRKQFKVMQKELEKSLEKTALTIDNKTKSVMSVRDFLDDFFKNIRNDNFAKIASSTFPMLGILGTFIAIAISMPDFTVNSSKELDNEISKLLSGVGTAFYASIFGIFLSLWWIFFERFGLSKIEKMTLNLEEIYSKYIWSQKELLKFKYNQKAILDNEFTKALKDIFNLDFIKELNKEHLNSYQNIIDTTSKGLKELEESLTTATKELNNTIKSLNETKESIEAKKSLEENLEEFNKAASELKSLLESFDTGLEGALVKVDRELASAVMHIQNMVKLVKE